MGNKTSKGTIDKGFQKKFNSALRSSKREFSDLIIRSSDGTEHHSQKVTMITKFPKLRSHLLRHSSLDTILSDQVIENFKRYADCRELTLDQHLLELLGMLLELVAVEKLRRMITDEVAAHVETLLSAERTHETMSTPALAAALFIAKIRDLDLSELFSKWVEHQTEQYGDVEDIRTAFKNYIKEGKDSPKSPLAEIQQSDSTFLFLNEE